MTNTFRTILIALAALTIGSGIGYFYAPDKVKIEERIVERTKIVKEENTKSTYKYDPITGKLIEHTEETGAKESSTDVTKTDKVTAKEKTQKQYAVKLGGSKSVTKADKPVGRVGAEVRLPFFNSWLGAEADLDVGNPKLGAYLRLEF